MLVLSALLASLSACPGSASTPPDAKPGPSDADSDLGSDPTTSSSAATNDDGGSIPGPSLPSGAACETNAECEADQVCEGLGCGSNEGRCAAKERICTRDLATYCGCDGQEFRGSGSCPGDRFAYRGPCEPALELGESCTHGKQCASGSCTGEGLEGCGAGASGVCSEPTCTTDLVTYCGCNGFEFTHSGSCPNQQFAYRGPCER